MTISKGSLTLFGSLLMLVVSAGLPAAAEGPAKDACAQGLQSDFAFEARVQVDAPVVLGSGPHGLRRIVPITGGTVTGPRLQGKVIPGGADWQVVRPADDVLEIEAKYTLESHDGVRIMVTNRGFRRGPKEVIDRLARGEKVDPALYYFRTTAQFEAPTGSAYAWLNQSVFVGVAERQADAAIIRFFEIK
jgi:hypothetical protein